MKTGEENLSKEDTNFLRNLGIVSIYSNIKKREMINIIRKDKEFQKEIRGYLRR